MTCSVNQPPEDDLLSGPEVITLEEFFDRDWRAAAQIHIIIGTEDLVNGVKGCTTSAKAIKPALSTFDEIIHVHVHVR